VWGLAEAEEDVEFLSRREALRKVVFVVRVLSGVEDSRRISS
jgi:hypothetical protein